LARKFTNLKDLEKYVQDEVYKSINKNEYMLEDVASQVMEKVTEKVVYDAYTPETYERRKEKNGLLDRRLMMFTYHGKTKNGTVSYFENTALGNDNLEDTFLVDTIEHGLEQNWNKTGEWSKPRPFVQKTAEVLNSGEIYPFALDTVKKMLKKSGLNIK